LRASGFYFCATLHFDLLGKNVMAEGRGMVGETKRRIRDAKGDGSC
jgi:hypothetical protein